MRTLAIALSILLLAAKAGAAKVIDFEQPTVTAPTVHGTYIEPETGVQFNATPDSAIGLCPGGDSQKLSTVRPGQGDSLVGAPITATLPFPIAGRVKISVEVQTAFPETVQVQLFDQAGNLVQLLMGRTRSPGVPACGLASKEILTGFSSGQKPVASIVISLAGSSDAAFVIDNFTFETLSAHALILVDRTSSMQIVRPSTGHSRCFDALLLAQNDVKLFFASHPEVEGSSVAVWTFFGTGPDPSAPPVRLTNGFVGQVEARAALENLDPELCRGATPLADSLCAAGDALVEAFPFATKRILAVSSDGGENTSDGPCRGGWSSTGPPDYDPESWQDKVKSQLTRQDVVEISIRYWSSVKLAQDKRVSDHLFFQDLAISTGGRYVFVGDGDPLPPLLPASVPEIPTLPPVGLAALAVLLALLAVWRLRAL